MSSLSKIHLLIIELIVIIELNPFYALLLKTETLIEQFRGFFSKHRAL